MSGCKLIVFDCDGTLVDSQQLIVDAMQRAFVGEGLVSPERAAILKTVGLSVPEAMQLLAPSIGYERQIRLAAAYREWCLALRRNGPAREPMFAGADALLRRLAAQENILLGIATGKSRRGVNRMVETEGLHGIFATIQTADDAPSKPHPAMLHQAMQETGTRPEDAVMIGDSTFDMAMAVSAGVLPVAVSWGYCAARALKRAGARQIARNFAELGALIDALTGSSARMAAAE